MQTRLLLTALLLGLVALVSAAATPLQKRSFKVERVNNPGYTGRNGAKALSKALRKFGMPVPDNLKSAIEAQKAAQPVRRAGPRHVARRGLLDDLNGLLGDSIGNLKDKADHHKGHKGNKQGGNAQPAAASNQTGEAQNTPNNNDAEFLTPVKVGGQTLNLDLDTGSSDLWVFNTGLDPALSQGHILFDPTKSKTFSLMKGAQFLVTYGDNSAAKGIVGNDVVDFGGAVVPNQAVELATDVTQEFVNDQNNDGLMGMAFGTLNQVQPQKQKTFFENVVDSLAQPVFTVDLRKGQPGTYEFGQIDSTKFTGNLASIPVNNTQGFWQFSSEQFAVNGGKAQESTPGFQAIADTGTTLLLADPKVVQGYYSQVQGAQDNAQAGGITVPCDAQLPDLELDIGGVYMAKVKGEDILFNKVSGNTCFGGLQATTGNLGIYGDIFFKSQFVVFNLGNTTLEMADHA